VSATARDARESFQKSKLPRHAPHSGGIILWIFHAATWRAFLGANRPRFRESFLTPLQTKKFLMAARTLINSLTAVILILFMFSNSAAAAAGAAAQSSGADTHAGSNAFGIHAGPLLPSRMGIPEILKGFGMRGTFPTHRGTFEIDSFFAHTQGTQYTSLSFDYKFNVVNDVMPTHFILGIHTDVFAPPNEGARFGGGWHYGGGFSIPVSELVSLRGDFKYRFSPGTSLYVGVGVEFFFSKDTGS
jgi:opacity protein-like surface antigen